jgi:hypothetical protein
VIQHLPTKCKVLISNPSTAKNWLYQFTLQQVVGENVSHPSCKNLMLLACLFNLAKQGCELLSHNWFILPHYSLTWNSLWTPVFPPFVSFYTFPTCFESRYLRFAASKISFKWWHKIYIHITIWTFLIQNYIFEINPYWNV